jgi:hypothetical protein
MNVIQDWQQLSELEAQQRALSEQIADLQRQSVKLQARMRAARRIVSLIDGIPVTCTYADLATDGCRGQTVPLEEDGDWREVVVYERKNKRGCWAVRINAKDGSFMRWDRWYGGKTLGLDRQWTADQARTVAVRWLVSGEFEE